MMQYTHLCFKCIYLYVFIYICTCAIVKKKIIDYILILGDGHQFIDRDLYMHFFDSDYGMDDHTP